MDGGDTFSSSSSRHKRSKSASDRNLDIARHGTSYRMGKECNESKNVRTSTKMMISLENRNFVLEGSKERINDYSSSHRASLEYDIKQLQMHLHQEKSVRVMLERQIGRASSTLSPGHRHFTAQTRELIKEIELLQEEIADREQHVLTLYRSIFDQCASGTASIQTSSQASPAHTKSREKKQPSIISSAFCSSKKFPLQAFQVLGSMKEAKRSNVLLKPKGRREAPSNGDTAVQVGSSATDHMKLPTAGRCYLSRTLKDHLYQCPSKVSEELIRCMAAIYCWVRSETAAIPEKACSPFLSRSSTSVILPRRSKGDGKEWSCRSVVEISSLSADKTQFSSASYAIDNYRLLVEQLERVDASVLEDGAKLAFWINVYNSLIMHAYLAYGAPSSSLQRMAFFHKAAYNIGGHMVTANSIEHTMLCCRTPRIGRWFETIISTAMWKKSGEEKELLASNQGLFSSQPLGFFALCTGAFSDPMLRVYSAKNVTEELEKAKKEFLQANVFVKKAKLFLPKILDRFAKESSISYDDLLAWLSESIDKKMHGAIEKCLDSTTKRKAYQIIEWLPYNTRFRYIFGKDLTEKPWWV